MTFYSASLAFLSIVALNGQHTYRFQVGALGEGTKDTVYFRLCNINNICGTFTRVENGWQDKGAWGYAYDYITNQYLGPITKTQIVIEGSDQLCLDWIKVEYDEYDAGGKDSCITAEVGGCDTLTVNLKKY